MSVLSELWKKLARSRKYRESFAASVAKRIIPLQIRVLRRRRQWSQETLAERSSLTQGVISRAEDPDYGNLTVNTLIRIGAGFDCVYLGRFIPFSVLGRWYVALENETALRVPSFDDDIGIVGSGEAAQAHSTVGALLNPSRTRNQGGLFLVTEPNPPIQEIQRHSQYRNTRDEDLGGTYGRRRKQARSESRSRIGRTITSEPSQGIASGASPIAAAS